MPPRRNTAGDAAMATLIAQSIAAVLPNLVTQLNQAQTTAGNHDNNLSTLSFKSFNSCNPPKFMGNEGATGLLQWFEGTENVFSICDCPEELKVRYAGSVLQKRALTWWNNEKRTRGAEATMALEWEEFKELMTAEFCPRNEVIKLEAEFNDLKQIGGNNLTYTTRFQELSILVPHMVTPLHRAIEKYIRGIPMPIQDTLVGRNPQSVEEAIRLAATLTDNHVKAGNLICTDINKSQLQLTSPQFAMKTYVEPPTVPKSNNRKRKIQNYATVTHAVPLNQIPSMGHQKKPYNGNHPLCNICKFHHPVAIPCRKCISCGGYGHTQNRCHNTPQPLAMIPQKPTRVRACFKCGDPNHFQNECPNMIIVNQGARGRAFNINTEEASGNQDAQA